MAISEPGSALDRPEVQRVVAVAVVVIVVFAVLQMVMSMNPFGVEAGHMRGTELTLLITTIEIMLSGTGSALIACLSIGRLRRQLITVAVSLVAGLFFTWSAYAVSTDWTPPRLPLWTTIPLQALSSVASHLMQSVSPVLDTLESLEPG